MSKSNYDVLAIGAHPDDVEMGSGGVLIDLNKRGYSCGIIVLTQGEMGTGGTVDLRLKEVEKGAKALGADLIKVFDWGDTCLFDDRSKQLEIAKIIRQTKPKVVLTPFPKIGHGRRQSHPDHVATGILTINAINLASLKKIDPSIPPHYVKKIFHYFLPPDVTPNFIVDITPHFDQWIEALSAHHSQFLNPEKEHDYIELFTSIARSWGLSAGCKYGQGLYSFEPIAIRNLMHLVE